MNLKPLFLIKRGYYILPSPSTALRKTLQDLKTSLLLGGGVDILGAAAAPAAPPSTNALLGDIFGLGNAASTTFYIPPKQEWLSAAKGKPIL